MIPVTPQSARALFKGIRYVLLDVDGVLWNGDHLIAGSPDAVLAMENRMDLHVRYVTNNATMSRAGLVAEKFVPRGFVTCDVEKMVSSAYAAALYLRGHGDAASRPSDREAPSTDPSASPPLGLFDRGNVFVIGNEGLHEEIQQALAPGRFTYGLELNDATGYTPSHGAQFLSHRKLPGPRRSASPHSESSPSPACCSVLDLDIAAVVIGMDYCFNPTKLAVASLCLQKHKLAIDPGHRRSDANRDPCLFVATNTDPQIAAGTEGALLPGSGCLVGALVTAVGRQPDAICGKPSTDLLEALELLERAACPPRHLRRDECLMVGDRLTTDIAFAKAGGVRTLFVLSGCETAADVAATGIVPDFVAGSLFEAVSCFLTAT